MFQNFLKIILRSLRKNKAYSFLNIFGLAIGIACAGLIFLWVEDEMNWDNNNVKKDRLYKVTNWSTPRPMAAALKNDIPGIVNTARSSAEDQYLLFSIGDKSVYASGRYVDSALFNMFTLLFTQGNAKSAFAQLHSIVITEKAAKKFFGNLDSYGDVIGKTVQVDHKQDFVVAGVIKNLPRNSTLQVEWLAPFESDPYYEASQSWGSYGPFTYVELDPKANPSFINSQLYNYIHRKDPKETSHSFLFPMKDWRLYDQFENGKETGGGRIEYVRMLSVIAWIILFIACINFMNLATARSEKRAREVGVRKVLGAGKKTLIAQFIGEALFMSTLAAVVALIIISLALPAFNELVQKQLLLGLSNPLHVVALLIIIIISGLAAGSYPSLYLSSFDPIIVLKGLKIKTGSAAFIRKGLVILQFTVAVVFIISTIIIYMEIKHVKSRKLGFNKDNLIEINMQNDIAKNFSTIKQDLLHTGFVENAAMSDHATISGGNSDNRFTWHGKAAGNEVNISFRNVSAEFILTSGMHIIEGRDFTENEASENSNVIITQSLAKIMGTESVIGKIIQSPRGTEQTGYKNFNVVGVVDDYVYGNIYGKPEPVIFFCKPAEDANLLYVRTKAQNNPEQALAKIQIVIKKNNPAYPFEYKFVDDQFNEMFLSEILISKLSGIFAALAIIISCLGLFGLAAYTGERRTKEIGIRKVLGASTSGIVGLLSKDFLQLVVVSCIVAFPISWWMMHDWLQNYQYRIEISWWIFLIAGVIAILIAFATISFQAIKAAIANPVKSLRTE